MLAAVLASWLATQQWSWDMAPASQAVTMYGIYWTPAGLPLCGGRKATFYTIQSCGAENGCEVGRCCGDVPMPPGESVYFLVTAVNAAGESETGYGQVAPVCP